MSKSEIKFDEHGSWIWKDDDAREPNLLLFVHGYTGDPEATWAKFPYLIRQVGQGFESGFEVASFGYESNLVFNFQNISTIAGLLLTFIDAHAHENKSIFIVAHSLGGVVTRRFLVETFQQPNHRVFFNKIRQVHFIGVPHKGAAKAPKLLKWLKALNPLVAELRQDSPELLETLTQWNNVIKQCTQENITHPKLFNYVGNKDWLAPLEQVIGEFNQHEEVRLVDGGHTAIAKPHNAENPLYKLVKRNILEEAKRLNPILDRGDSKGNPAPPVNVPAIPVIHELLTPPADFTGREADLNELMTKLETAGEKISGFLLHGMNGIGKTVLALKLAELLTPLYPDAQFFLDLKGVSDKLNGVSNKPLSPAEAMAHVILAYKSEEQAFKLPESETELERLYRSVLRDKRALLLMDNARDAKQVKPLFPPNLPKTCLLLVTSIQRFKLPGLDPNDVKTLPPKEACQLLLTIAPRIGAAAEAMAKLCGYLPLALRLTSSALAEQIDLSPVDYLAQLENAQTRLGLVEAPLSLSYDLLAAETQKWWRLLSVFPDTFDKPAGAAVWEIEVESAQKTLSLLVKYSLVEWQPATGRYRLHDLVRLFAAKQCTEAERAVGLQRHADHYATVLRSANKLYLEGDESIQRGLALFDLEWENIQAGQAWAQANAEKDEAIAQLCSAYPNAGTSCLELRQHPRERIRWREAALSVAKRLKDRAGEGAHLRNLGIAYLDLGEPRRAIKFFKQALVIARKIRIPASSDESNALGCLGNAYINLDKPCRAIVFFKRVLKFTREVGDRRDEAKTLGNLGIAYDKVGQHHRAIDFHELRLKIAREIGDRHGESNTLGNIGVAYSNLGELRSAIEFYEQQLKITRDIGDRRGEGTALFNMSLAQDKLGEREQPIANAEAALKIYEQIENPNAAMVRRQLDEWRGSKT